MKRSTGVRAACLLLVAALATSSTALAVASTSSAPEGAVARRSGTLADAVAGAALDGALGSAAGFGSLRFPADIAARRGAADVPDFPIAEADVLTAPVTGTATDLVVTRISGNDRYATAAIAARKAFSSAETAVIISGEQMPDAGFAPGLAGVFDAPVLATRPDELPYVTRDALQTLGVTKVFLIGDTSIIGGPVATALDDLGISVERVGGATASSRAADVAQRMQAELGASMPAAVILTDDWRGAVAAGPVAYSQHIPVLLLTNLRGDCVLPAETSTALTALGDAGRTVLWAGPLNEQQSITWYLPPGDYDGIIAEQDPAVLSVRFAEHGADQGWFGAWTHAGVSSGDLTGPYETLGAGAALGAIGAPSLFTRQEHLSYVVDRLLYDMASSVTDVWIFGGTAALPTPVATAAADQSVPVPPAPLGVVALPGNRLVLVACDEASDVVDAEYRFWRASSEFGTYTSVETAAAPYFWDQGRVNGTTYWYKVSVIDAQRGLEGPPSAARSAQPAPAAPERVAGTDRYQTALAISQANFFEADTAVIATGANYPDALAASGLCGVYDAPLLLTPSASLPSGLLAELERLGVWRVLLVGGTSAISPGVQSALSSAGYTVARFPGANRYDTAAGVARHVLARTGGHEVFVVRGDDFADALAVSPWAYWYQVPVLLAQPSALPGETERVLLDYPIEFAVVVGGTSAISVPVANRLPVDDWDRVYGSTRYTTPVALAEVFGMPLRPHYALGVATGTGFADALGGGVACGSWGSPLMLTRPAGMAPEVRSLVSSMRTTVQSVQVYGGPKALPDTITADLRTLLK